MCFLREAAELYRAASQFVTLRQLASLRPWRPLRELAGGEEAGATAGSHAKGRKGRKGRR
jgi:hypothetical protein